MARTRCLRSPRTRAALRFVNPNYETKQQRRATVAEPRPISLLCWFWGVVDCSKQWTSIRAYVEERGEKKESETGEKCVYCNQQRKSAGSALCQARRCVAVRGGGIPVATPASHHSSCNSPFGQLPVLSSLVSVLVLSSRTCHTQPSPAVRFRLFPLLSSVSFLRGLELWLTTREGTHAEPESRC